MRRVAEQARCHLAALDPTFRSDAAHPKLWKRREWSIRAQAQSRRSCHSALGAERGCLTAVTEMSRVQRHSLVRRTALRGVPSIVRRPLYRKAAEGLLD